MNVTIDLIDASASQGSVIPEIKDFQHWSAAALHGIRGKEVTASVLPPVGESGADIDEFELSIRLVTKAESAELNEQYRHKHGATNILSFPMDSAMIQGIPLLGDLAICADIVRDEALAQDKTELAHWAHLTVHGVLHLKGYDHENDKDAQEMEKLEIQILDTLGFNNPYL